jgi:hypothetical protein
MELFEELYGHYAIKYKNSEQNKAEYGQDDIMSDTTECSAYIDC